ncbi:MAG: cbb3-type cytochrome oxidase assembly protein CcoS [Acidobacteriota bacterium]|nr:cbb3-type cytochrome oxidase assembly protein CcoS [Acidobacteriota bacterium]
MGILILLVPVTLLLTGCAVGAWYWACRNRQFDDLDSPAYKMLLDDHQEKKESI